MAIQVGQKQDLLSSLFPDIAGTPNITDLFAQEDTVKDISKPPSIDDLSDDGKDHSNDLFPDLNGDIEKAEQDQITANQDSSNQQVANILTGAALTGAANDKVSAINDKSMQTAQQVADAQTETYAGLTDTMQKAQLAIKLSDSQNPMDHLQLWSLQLTDPLYTDEGNEARMQYYNQTAATIANKGAVDQNLYKAQIDKITADLATATAPGDNLAKILQVREAQGATRLAALKDLQASRMSRLKDMQDAQTITIANTSPEETDALLAQAKINGGIATKNGVQLSTQALTEHKQNLEDRTYLESVRANESVGIALSDMQLPDVQASIAKASNSADGVYVTPTGVKISVARLQERAQQLTNQDLNSKAAQLAIDQQLETRAKETDKRLLGTMDLPTLNSLLQSGGMYQGRPIDSDSIKAEIQFKQQKQVNDLTLAGQVASVGDINQSAVALDTQLTDMIKKVDASASPEFAAKLAGMQSALHQAAGTVDPANNPNDITKAYAAGAINNLATKTLPDAITTEAKRRGGKDPQLQQAYEYVIKGQPIPEELITASLTDKVIKGANTNEWLSSKDSGSLVRNYNAELTRLNLVHQADQVPPDKAGLKQEAADYAVQQLKESQSAALTDQIFGNQATNGKNNPLQVAGISGAKILELTHGADAQGLSNYLDAINKDGRIPPETINGYKTGTIPIPDEMATDLAMYQSAALYMSLEQTQPGLGTKYVDWWNGPDMQPMIRQYAENKLGQTGSKMADNIAISLQVPNLGGAMAAYGQTLQAGETNAKAQQYQLEHAKLMTFGGNATNAQVFLLDTDKTMTDKEKQDSMTMIIQPLLDSAKANGYGFDQTMAFVEEGLTSMKPDEPIIKKLQTKILANRKTGYNIIDSLLTLNDYQTNPGLRGTVNGPAGGYGVIPMGIVATNIAAMSTKWSQAIGLTQSPLDAAESAVSWYKKPAGSQ